MSELVINGIRVDLPTHAADLDAHHYASWQKVFTGEWLYLPVQGISANFIALTADKLTANPLIIQRDMSFDQATIHVKTLDAGETVRVGIYEDGINLYPGALVEDLGEMSVNGTGIVNLAINPVLSLTAGLYWVVILAKATTAELFNWTQSPMVLGINKDNLTQALYSWGKTSVSYGALPDPFTAGGAEDIAPGPVFYLRPSSLN